MNKQCPRSALVIDRLDARFIFCALYINALALISFKGCHHQMTLTAIIMHSGPIEGNASKNTLARNLLCARAMHQISFM